MAFIPKNWSKTTARLLNINDQIHLALNFDTLFN
jgi:hypothetical protein